jgi:hypothetical protein
MKRVFVYRTQTHQLCEVFSRRGVQRRRQLDINLYEFMREKAAPRNSATEKSSHDRELESYLHTYIL